MHTLIPGYEKMGGGSGQTWDKGTPIAKLRQINRMQWGLRFGQSE